MHAAACIAGGPELLRHRSIYFTIIVNGTVHPYFSRIALKGLSPYILFGKDYGKPFCLSSCAQFVAGLIQLAAISFQLPLFISLLMVCLARDWGSNWCLCLANFAAWPSWENDRFSWSGCMSSEDYYFLLWCLHTIAWSRKNVRLHVLDRMYIRD